MNIGISILLSLLLGLLAFLKKSLTIPALTLAVIFSIFIANYGGLTSFIILLVVFLGSIITKVFNKSKKSEKRKLIQIISNVGIGTLSLIIFKITRDNLYLLIYASVMAESLADTLASDIGTLSKKEPINILTLKKGEKGLSGNISMLGLTASLIGSILIALIYYIGIERNITSLIIITLSGFLGSIIDSILGSAIQVKYKCEKCNKITEKKEHCGKKTNYYRGIKWIDNNLVNLLSNGIIFIILNYSLIWQIKENWYNIARNMGKNYDY